MINNDHVITSVEEVLILLGEIKAIITEYEKFDVLGFCGSWQSKVDENSPYLEAFYTARV